MKRSIDGKDLKSEDRRGYGQKSRRTWRHTSPWLRRHHGKAVVAQGFVGFAAYKNHVSLFDAIPDELKKELGPYKRGRGSIQFPLDKPLPLPLITKIVKAHAKMNETGIAMHV